MTNNLHLSLGHLLNASRVMKETNSLIKFGKARQIYIACYGEKEDEKSQSLDPKRTIYRIHKKDKKANLSLLEKITDTLKFSFKAIKFAKQKKIDLVNIHSLSLLPVGVLIKLICRSKLVYDAHELETETVHKKGLTKKIAKFLEWLLIRFVDLTIVVGDGIEEWYRNKYKIENIVTVMNCPLHQKPYGTNLLREELGIPEEKKIVLYQGGLFLGRGIEGLLSAFSKHDDGKHVLVCMGFGELDNMIKEHAAKHENIFFQTAAAPEIVLQYTSSADYGISYIDNPSLNDRLCLPNKLFEFIMAGLPVLVNDAPEMKKLVTENKVGAVLQELTFEAIENGLKEIEAMNQEKLAKNLEETGQKCCWENQEKIMIEAYNKFIY